MKTNRFLMELFTVVFLSFFMLSQVHANPESLINQCYSMEECVNIEAYAGSATPRTNIEYPFFASQYLPKDVKSIDVPTLSQLKGFKAGFFKALKNLEKEGYDVLIPVDIIVQSREREDISVSEARSFSKNSYVAIFENLSWENGRGMVVAEILVYYMSSDSRVKLWTPARFEKLALLVRQKYVASYKKMVERVQTKQDSLRIERAKALKRAAPQNVEVVDTPGS